MALSKQGAGRLERLARFMDKLPKKEWQFFDMHQTKFMGCGTAACAAGWGERVPGFKEAGYSFSASDEFFGISSVDWEKLFYSRKAYQCKTPKQWAKHCRKFIRENSK